MEFDLPVSQFHRLSENTLRDHAYGFRIQMQNESTVDRIVLHSQVDEVTNVH